MRRAALPLIGVSLLLCASPTLAQETEGWKLDSKRQAYELKLQKPPFPVPLEIPTSRALGSGSFRDGRVPTFEVVGPGDVIWYYLLGLPEGELKNRRKVTVDDTFKTVGGSLFVKGEQTLKRKGKKSITIKSVLTLTSDVQGSPITGREATLEVSSTFDLVRGITRSGQMTLSAKVMLLGKARSIRWGGKLVLGETIDSRGAGFHTQVQEAIRKGSVWLKADTRGRLATFKTVAAKKPANQRLGQLAIQCFALLRSGVKPEALNPEFAWMAEQPLTMTYSVSLWIMALEARSIRREAIKPRARTRSVARYERGDVDKENTQRIAAAVKWLVDNHKDGWWNYEGIKATPSRPGDRSNSQFAILALHSALACGVEVPRKLWEDALAEVLKSQEATGPAAPLRGSVFSAGSPFESESDSFDDDEDDDPNASRTRGDGDGTEVPAATRARGWAYGVNRKARGAYGSMTAAGVSSLAIIREALGAEGGATQSAGRGSLDALREGLAWLAANFSATTNPVRDGHYYYWLYSLEKAMDTTGVERLVTHEWYREVASELIQRQDPKGNWGDSKDTAMALLVLNRATLPARLEIGNVKRRATGGDESQRWDKVVVDGVGELGLRQLLSAMASSPETAGKRLKLAQQALPLVDEENRPRLLKRLMELFDSPHKPTRRWATKACREMAGTDDPKALRVFRKAFSFVRRAGEARTPASIPRIRAILKNENSGPALRRQSILVLNRLRAVEAIPELLDALNAPKPKERDFVWGCLVSIAGGEHEPFDPKSSAKKRWAQIEAWHDWYDENGAELQTQEEIRRALVGLGKDDARAEAAEKALRAHGEQALLPLTDALHDDATRERAHALLKELSGGDLPPDPEKWRGWLKKGRPDVVAVKPDEPKKDEDEDEDEDDDDEDWDAYSEDEDEDADEDADADEDEDEADSSSKPAAVVVKTPEVDRRATEQGTAEWGLVPRPSQRGK